jgi:hypothetical protein
MYHRPPARTSLPALPLIVLVACLGATPPARAADGLDIKVGLWEATMISNRSGAPPIPPAALAKLSPEQRARIQAAAQKEAAAGPKTHVYKSCVTTQDLKEGAFRADDEDDDGAACTHQLVSQTKTLQQASMSCTGEVPRTSTLRVEALDREHVKGVVQGTAGPSTFSMQLSARWLGADCAGADD